MAHAAGTPFGRMPDDWLRHLPRAAPLSLPVRWRQIVDMPADIAIAATRLDLLPLTQADRLAFRAIRGTTAAELVCCASRRDATGRLLGLSPLMPAEPAPERMRRARIPEHAMSEQDRMMARPDEFASTPRSASADACWQDWNTPAVTAHDGAVRPGHPVLARALGRVHSATSLRSLLRNLLGFTWHYALGWREPDAGVEARWSWTRCSSAAWCTHCWTRPCRQSRRRAGWPWPVRARSPVRLLLPASTPPPCPGRCRPCWAGQLRRGRVRRHGGSQCR